MPNAYLTASCLGIVAGMRSMTAPALASRYLAERKSDDLEDSPLEWFATDMAASVFTALAVGEIVADKLPTIPARTDPGPLIGRALTGALSGAALCIAEGEGMVEGAIVGALAAAASTHLFYQFRRLLGEKTPLPDFVLAVLEDAAALTLGRTALKETDA